MHGELGPREPEANDDVERDPCHGEPAGPVASAEHKDAGNNGKNADELDPEGVVVQELVQVEFGEVIDESDGAAGDENDGEKRDRDRACSHKSKCRFRILLLTLQLSVTSCLNKKSEPQMKTDGTDKPES